MQYTELFVCLCTNLDLTLLLPLSELFAYFLFGVPPNHQKGNAENKGMVQGLPLHDTCAAVHRTQGQFAAKPDKLARHSHQLWHERRLAAFC